MLFSMDLLEEIYMEQPRGFIDAQFPSHICRLHKSLFGLKQAPRAWFTRFSQTLLELGFVSSTVDSSLFVFHQGIIHPYILIYVDDILFTGTSTSHIASVIAKLQQVFKLKDLGNLSYFLGIQAVRSSQGLHLRQAKYISDLLSRSKMMGAKPFSSPCLAGSKMSTRYYSLSPNSGCSTILYLNTSGYSIFCKQVMSAHAYSFYSSLDSSKKGSSLS